MPAKNDLWQQIQEDCHEAAPLVGAATGALYAFGTEMVTGNAPLAGAVDQVIGDFVGQNWEHVCDLPANVAELYSDAPSVSAPDAPSQAPDTSISPDM